MKSTILLSRSRLLGFAVAMLVIGMLATSFVNRTVRAAETEAAARAVAEGEANVTAGELAHWILDKRQDYQLIDLREPWQFDDYHVPTATNVPAADLFRSENLKRLDAKKKIVVYGLGAGRSAQIQVLLGMKGYHAYALEDGIIGWWDEVMTPTSLRSAKPAPSGYQQARQLREYFMTGSATIAPQSVNAMPAVAPLTPPVPAAEKASSPAPKRAAKPPAKTATKPAAKTEPAAKKDKPPADDEEKKRLKLGVGCS
jgi:rhodanese-related sulfurtransferase